MLLTTSNKARIVVINKGERKRQTPTRRKVRTMKNVITINRGEKITGAVYFTVTRKGYTAFAADGTEICNFNIKGNHSMAAVRTAAGIEVRYENDPAFGWGVPANAKWELAFENDGDKYFKLA